MNLLGLVSPLPPAFSLSAGAVSLPPEALLERSRPAGPRGRPEAIVLDFPRPHLCCCYC